MMMAEREDVESAPERDVIVVMGNPVDGFAFYGPFVHAEAAKKWATEEADDRWWIAELHPVPPED